MKKSIFLILIFLATAISCRKENDQTIQPITAKTDSLTLSEVQHWYNSQSVNSNLQTQSTSKAFSVRRLNFDWNKAGNIRDAKRNWWTVALDGQPTFKGAKQGYRKLAFVKDSTGTVQARILEIIPDVAYIHIHHGADTKSFTGHVFIFDGQYNLLGGRVYHDGKQVGQIKPKAPTSTGLAATVAAPNPRARVDELAISADCQWNDSSYIDGDGVFTVYSEYDCTYSIYDDGFYPGGGGGGGTPSGDPLGGGGGGGGSEGTAPAPVDLPGQLNAAIDPKAYMNCFGSLPDIGSKETITVYVVEPQPGLPFNIGVNSVGHTAIGLTKTYNGQTITQTVGFYPTSSKLAATGSAAKVVDNSQLNYTVSITYNVLPFEFNAIANYIANPPATYNLYTNNCTNFVYNACTAGGITLPDPTGNLGMFQTGMCPAALGSSISDVASVTNANVNGGQTGQSHGPCN